MRMLPLALLLAGCLSAETHGWTCNEEGLCSQGDASEPIRDAVSPLEDAGPDPAEDSGPPPFDAGSRSADAGQPVVDSGPAPVDAGPAAPRNCAETRGQDSVTVTIDGNTHELACSDGWTRAVLLEALGCTVSSQPWNLWRETASRSRERFRTCKGVAMNALVGPDAERAEFWVKVFLTGNTSTSPNWSRFYKGLTASVWAPVTVNSRHVTQDFSYSSSGAAGRWQDCSASIGSASSDWKWSLASCGGGACGGVCDVARCGLANCAQVANHGFALSFTNAWAAFGDSSSAAFSKVEIWTRPGQN